ncbi:hypothetical protein U0070_012756, partial [Myodes glareolus]
MGTEDLLQDNDCSPGGATIHALHEVLIKAVDASCIYLHTGTADHGRSGNCLFCRLQMTAGQGETGSFCWDFSVFFWLCSS